MLRLIPRAGQQLYNPPGEDLDGVFAPMRLAKVTVGASESCPSPLASQRGDALRPEASQGKGPPLAHL